MQGHSKPCTRSCFANRADYGRCTAKAWCWVRTKQEQQLPHKFHAVARTGQAKVDRGRSNECRDPTAVIRRHETFCTSCQPAILHTGRRRRRRRWRRREFGRRRLVAGERDVQLTVVRQLERLPDGLREMTVTLRTRPHFETVRQHRNLLDCRANSRLLEKQAKQ